MNRKAISRTIPVALSALLSLSFVSVLTRGVEAAPGARPSSAHALSRRAPASVFRKVDMTLTRMAKQKVFSGSVLVARRGAVLLNKGYGMADRQHRVPNTALTQFRIGTTTNQFTAMAVLQLQAEGKLHVQNHVCTYVVPCPKAWLPITLRQLLTHTSGMADFTAVGDESRPTTPAHLLAAIRRTPLIARPGSSWSYSNLGYDVLGYIIEKVSHASFGAFLRAHVFTAARMSNAGYNDTIMKPRHLAVGYQDAFTKAMNIDMSNAYSAAGVYATVRDLYRWDQALSTLKVASPKIVSKMFTTHWLLCRKNCPVPPDPPEWGYKTPVSQDGYGYGWGIARLQRSHHRLFASAGGFTSGLSYNGRYPDDKVVIIVLTNQDDVDIAAIVQLLQRAALKKQ